ncbi:Aste57867_4761 [Aphanomyces stellatus]|uniref:Aste57867_4761 protein n=1 Tax=Aphanomyces stellatus TaxID=120398 RepID=A0A485KBV4_9STRA|nr:hypothetical protein As57867_004748 [Aphanomyces stellatus]VFT81857.1 Aste57867_4761 [Aphanomyces stellatus]
MEGVTAATPTPCKVDLMYLPSIPTERRWSSPAHDNKCLDSFLEQLSPRSRRRRRSVAFCDKPRYIDSPCIETLDELVVRVSRGFPRHDMRPAHTKLHGFCHKSFMYLKYRHTSCASVFSLTATDIAMWRRLGHYDWDAADMAVDKIAWRQANESTTSNESDGDEDNDLVPSSSSDEGGETTMVAAVDRDDVDALVAVMNSVLSKGDASFSVIDIVHLCRDATAPPPSESNDDEEEDGWC